MSSSTPILLIHNTDESFFVSLTGVFKKVAESDMLADRLSGGLNKKLISTSWQRLIGLIIVLAQKLRLMRLDFSHSIANMRLLHSHFGVRSNLVTPIVQRGDMATKDHDISIGHYWLCRRLRPLSQCEIGLVSAFEQECLVLPSKLGSARPSQTRESTALLIICTSSLPP